MDNRKNTLEYPDQDTKRLPPEVNSVYLRHGWILWLDIKNIQEGDILYMNYNRGFRHWNLPHERKLIKLKNGLYKFKSTMHKIYFKIVIIRLNERIRFNRSIYYPEYLLDSTHCDNIKLFPLPIEKNILIEFTNDRYGEYYNQKIQKKDLHFHHFVNYEKWKKISEKP